MRQLLPLLLVFILPACGRNDARNAIPAGGLDSTAHAAPSRDSTKPAPLTLESPAFRDGGAIPKQYTCDGANISPALRWGGVPPSTRSLSLVCDDPDAPSKPWVHWVIWSMPGTSAGSIAEGAGTAAGMDGQGTNDFGKIGYGGPCPPSGLHHYHFRLYALDTALAPSGEATRNRLMEGMKGHILGMAELVGTYRKE